MQIEVNITNVDIQKAIDYLTADGMDLSDHCPLARALRRALDVNVRVTHGAFYIGHGAGKTAHSLPSIPAQFTIDFDRAANIYLDGGKIDRSVFPSPFTYTQTL